MQITSNHWENLENDFFDMTGVDREEIKLLHAVIRNSNKTNVKKIKASQTKKTIKVKESFTIKTATTLEAPKLKYAKHAGIRFESDKPAIASVDKKGKVKGKKAGKAAIYAYAQNGVFVKIKVTVKK